MQSSGAIKTRLKHTGPPLGLAPREGYSTAPVVGLSPGDIVVLLTDGLEEALSSQNEYFGSERVLSVVRCHAQQTAEEILEAIFESVKAFSSGKPQGDDLTGVVIKIASAV
jgi:sigma-B regulation protein RsbU (phosphoserine phosphatase)